jgi:hypothetical protein
MQRTPFIEHDWRTQFQRHDLDDFDTFFDLHDGLPLWNSTAGHRKIRRRTLDDNALYTSYLLCLRQDTPVTG